MSGLSPIFFQRMPSGETNPASPLLPSPATALYFSSGLQAGLRSKNGEKLCAACLPSFLRMMLFSFEPSYSQRPSFGLRHTTPSSLSA